MNHVCIAHRSKVLELLRETSILDGAQVCSSLTSGTCAPRSGTKCCIRNADGISFHIFEVTSGFSLQQFTNVCVLAIAKCCANQLLHLVACCCCNLQFFIGQLLHWLQFDCLALSTAAASSVHVWIWMYVCAQVCVCVCIALLQLVWIELNGCVGSLMGDTIRRFTIT